LGRPLAELLEVVVERVPQAVGGELEVTPQRLDEPLLAELVVVVVARLRRPVGVAQQHLVAQQEAPLVQGGLLEDAQDGSTRLEEPVLAAGAH
jgi:hypothetical protein